MGEIVAAVLSDASVRTFVEGVAIKIISDIFHRRSMDPNFLANSDAAFSALAAAKTDEDQLSAIQSIQALIASSA